MFRFAVVLACFALCQGQAVLPLVAPAAHLHAPLLHTVPNPLHHGYATGLLSHGYVAKPVYYGHHILKRSPHVVGHVPLNLAPITHVAPVAHVGPAVSHQSRLDVHTSPGVVAAPIVPVVKPLVAPVPIAPFVYKAVVSPDYYGGLDVYGGHYGGLGGHYGSLGGHYGGLH